ncbi:hypothetical protein K432DRAFT_11963 [Lepidopterella palustris CBS 459.81]|uniref:Uncharacterized protein n=1 Tax=Lepidopterella palustris CBS 459.81 TaxID=1314670 RepID=A0A8E2DX54_9PEZI|nr:hypothetical protein K432DRAFT_11963 [Lepidopterella palustris CBS 459.81]
MANRARCGNTALRTEVAHNSSALTETVQGTTDTNESGVGEKAANMNEDDVGEESIEPELAPPITHEWAIRELSIHLLKAPNTDPESLEAYYKKLRALRGLVEELAPRRPNSAETQATRAQTAAIDNLVKREPPIIGGSNQQSFDCWVLAVQNQFKVANAHLDCERRTRWAVNGLRKEKNIEAEVHRRFEAADGLEMLWEDLKRLVQDHIQDPVVRRFETAIRFYTSTIKDK